MKVYSFLIVDDAGRPRISEHVLESGDPDLAHEATHFIAAEWIKANGKRVGPVMAQCGITDDGEHTTVICNSKEEIVCTVTAFTGRTGSFTPEEDEDIAADEIVSRFVQEVFGKVNMINSPESLASAPPEIREAIMDTLAMHRAQGDAEEVMVLEAILGISQPRSGTLH